MIVCISPSYPIKDWTRFELEIGQRAAKKRAADYILPLRIGGSVSPLVGLRETLGYQTLTNEEDIERIVGIVVSKLASGVP